MIGTPLAVENVSVTNGLFTVPLDFGAAAFTGEARWLEIAVRPGASSNAFTPLAPRVLIPFPGAASADFPLDSWMASTTTRRTARDKG